ncbi:CPBP family intramembrane metalloprotease [Clostridium sp. 'deep sea']|uniref:CPBP family intramembrane glutamic endopeptidase n=1 Tax=Clostridium sp. 'deep sea' TaxID=2779445 RepID=UPI0018964EC7|nr:type II CAAX endopeptidase family protein [Clostridium sp. 'deep sea']QOR34813.1 CPBP family intramembrane metalloprotease [Clostridium sp. 'deep sea']
MIIEDRKFSLSFIKALLLCVMWVLFPVALILTLTLLTIPFIKIIPNFNILDFFSNSYLEMLISYMSVYLCILIITKNKWSRLKIRLKGNSNLFWVLGTIVFAVGLNIVVSEIDNIVQLIFPLTDIWLETFNSIGELPVITYILTVVVTAPVVEELFLRGVILRGLGNKYSKTKAIILTAFLFGLVHLNIWQFVAAFLGGLFLSWLYVNSKALLLSILAHAVHNGMSLVVDFLGIKVNGYNVLTANGSAHQPLWFTLLGFIIMAGGALLFIKAKRKNALQITTDTNSF